jgi:hypothetical protein
MLGCDVRHKGVHDLPREGEARETDDLARRRKLLAFLENKEAVWRDEDHPELARGSAAWVRKLRKQSDRTIRRGR